MSEIPDKVKIAYEALSAVNFFHEDISLAKRMLEADDSMFLRRQYIRCLFAAYESSIWQYKQMCLKLYKNGVVVNLSQDEILFLSDKKSFLDGNDVLTERKIKVSLKDNLIKTVNILNKFTNGCLNPKADKSGWDAFSTAIQIRDKLMHPKSVGEFNVSVRQLAQVTTSFKWFLTVVHSQILFTFLDDCQAHEEIEH